MLSKSDLFARLAEGHAARITVVTPNRRLAQALVSDFDSHQIKQGKSVWDAADILPFGAFVERLYEEALYSPPEEMRTFALPLLLTSAQEQMLWVEAIQSSRSGSGLLAIQQS